MPAEFVSSTSLASISGKSAPPTPAAAECAQRSRGARRKSGRETPKPKYASASRGPSRERHPQHVVTPHEPLLRHRELPRRAGHLELEDAVGRVVVGLAR